MANVLGSWFTDANANGAFDDGDGPPPLAGIRIYADLNFNGLPDANEPRTFGSAPDWSLYVPFGRHLLRAVVPAGHHLSAPADGGIWVDSQPGVTPFASFGVWSAGTFAASSFIDQNGNGRRDIPDTPYVTGRTAYVDLDDDGELDPDEPAAGSDFLGYMSVRARPGTYRVRFTAPPGWTVTDPASGEVVHEFRSGVASPTVDVGTTGPTVVHGFAFDDVNGDTRYDATEMPRAGVLAFYDTDGDLTPDANEKGVHSGPDGRFRLSGPFGGAGRVVLLDPYGPTLTGPLHVWAEDDFIQEVMVIGAVRPHARIFGRLFVDLDGDGDRVTGEPLLPGRPVWADLNDNGEMDPGEPATQTGGDGHFVLTAPPGPVRVRTVESDGYSFGVHGGAFPVVNVTGHETYTAGDGALGVIDGRQDRPRSGVQGYAFEDVNRNARFDPGERGIPGRTVFADANGNGVLDQTERHAVTDSAGYYVISELEPSKRYTVREVASATHEPVPIGYAEFRSANFQGEVRYLESDLPSVPRAAAFVGEARLDRESGHILRLQFARDVATTLGRFDFAIRDRRTDRFLAPEETWELTQSTPPGAATSAVLNLSPRLPDGEYELILRAGAVADVAGKPMASDFVFPFALLSGDANADGVVNADDYFRIDRGFLAQPQDAGYSAGDFNYDGKVDADDYFLIDQAFLAQGAAAPTGSVGTAGASAVRDHSAPVGVATETMRTLDRGSPRAIFADEPITDVFVIRSRRGVRRR